jgi:hypothetical protein
LLAALGVGCKSREIVATKSQIQFEQDHLEFDASYAASTTRTLTVSVVNASTGPTAVVWDLPDQPFSLSVPEELPPGPTKLSITLAMAFPGNYAQRLRVRQAGDVENTAVMTLGATLRAVPICVASSTCLTSTFDFERDACVEAALTDGTQCDTQTACVVDGRCLSGRCIGVSKSCDDGNACTSDVCYPETGCQSVPAPPCPGDGVCRVGVCDPLDGCRLDSATDGTSCGSVQTCVTAEICIDGQCVVRDPPDGYVCEEASPCSPEKRCVSNACVATGGTSTLTESWSFDSAYGWPDAGVADLELHDLVLEPGGEATLTGFFKTPAVIHANTANPLLAPSGPSRRCILWGPRLVCADYPSLPNGRVTALNPASGETIWTFDVRAERPDFLKKVSQIFLARLVVQDGDRLAAIFEAYPLNSLGSSGTMCRVYFLVVLDASGRLIRGAQIEDDLLAQCNHPHPYGAASDSVGNLYLAFSQSTSQQAPLVPSKPTLLMSYTHDGVFRWKLTDHTLVGGELAVARGLLYPENSQVVLEATTGRPLLSLPRLFGRAVIAQNRLIPSPVPETDSLTAFEAGSTETRWRHILPPQHRFWSDQIRLASWATSRGDRTVALTFTVEGTGDVAEAYSLHAIDVQSGQKAFSCPLPSRLHTAPQLFEIANGSTTVMEGAISGTGLPACGKCDPPFAGSSAKFHSYGLRGVKPASDPWVGTFGGPGHDHHEDSTSATPN